MMEIVSNFSYCLRHSISSLLVPNQLRMFMFAFKHLNRNWWRINHCVKKHGRKELADSYSHLRATQLVRSHLCKKFGACFANLTIVWITKLIQKINDNTCVKWECEPNSITVFKRLPFECASLTSCGALVRPDRVSRTRCFWKSSSFITRKNVPRISQADISVTHSLLRDRSEIISNASVLICRFYYKWEGCNGKRSRGTK